VRPIMLVQIYEISSAEEAAAVGRIGVDHVGVLVGSGAYPREHSIEAAKYILSAIPSKGSVLCLSADIALIEHILVSLEPPILHLGASTDLLTPEHVCGLKKKFDWLVCSGAFRYWMRPALLSHKAMTELQICFYSIVIGRGTLK